MAEDPKVQITAIPFGELKEPSPIKPQFATVREIDIISETNIYLFFSQGTISEDLDKYKGGLRQLLIDLHNDDYEFQDNGKISNMPDPPLTPLSLNNKEKKYVIYKLKSGRNWQFAYAYPPFTIASEYTVDPSHYTARRVDKYGNAEQVKEVKPKEWAPVKDDCLVAYFVSDGEKAKGSKNEYTHALNLHIDLVYQGKKKARMPLIVDPDIRHPGGSGE